MNNKELNDCFEFRYIHPNEVEQIVEIELICFPPHEACSPKMMRERMAVAPDFCLVAIDKETGKIAGFLNGLATNEDKFRDEFFTDASLHNLEGTHVMLLGLDVLPKYRCRGLASKIMRLYLEKERARGRKTVILTCLDEKVAMYEKMGYKDLGISASVWGNEIWHDMSYEL